MPSSGVKEFTICGLSKRSSIASMKRLQISMHDKVMPDVAASSLTVMNLAHTALPSQSDGLWKRAALLTTDY